MPSVIPRLCPSTLSFSFALLPPFTFILSCAFLFPLSIAHSLYTPILPLHTYRLFLSLSLFSLYRSISFIFIATPLRSLLFVFSRMPSSVSRKTSFSSSFIFLPLPLPSHLFLSLFRISHTSHSSLRVSSSVSLMFPISSLSRSPFFSLSPLARPPPLRPFCSFSSLSPVSLAFYRRTLPSSRSIELRSSGSFYLAQSSYFLRLFFFFCALSFLSSPLSSSSPLARSHGILRARCILFLSLSLYSFLSHSLFFFLARGGQELFILYGRVVRNLPDFFGWARMTLILKYYLAPPSRMKGRTKLESPLSTLTFPRVYDE